MCVSASPTNADVIRRAAALSDAMGAELIAVYVEDVELRDEAQARAVHDHLSLAEAGCLQCLFPVRHHAHGGVQFRRSFIPHG